jgi:hypothetical protein
MHRFVVALTSASFQVRVNASMPAWVTSLASFRNVSGGQENAVYATDAQANVIRASKSSGNIEHEGISQYA